MDKLIETVELAGKPLYVFEVNKHYRKSGFAASFEQNGKDWKCESLVPINKLKKRIQAMRDAIARGTVVEIKL